MSVCLDSWAVLEWLNAREPAAELVERTIADRPVMSWVNMVEVYYRVERDHGRENADSTLTELRRDIEMELPAGSRMVEVARLKAEHPIALADCFAVATAAGRDRPLLTGDPEILDRGPDLPCRLRDLRRS